MGRSLSCVAPATGRLMLANWPPLGCSQVHTLGGTYSLIVAVPFLQGRELGRIASAFQCQDCARLTRADRQEAGQRAVPFAFDILDDRRALSRCRFRST